MHLGGRDGYYGRISMNSWIVITENLGNGNFFKTLKWASFVTINSASPQKAQSTNLLSSESASIRCRKYVGVSFLRLGRDKIKWMIDAESEIITDAGNVCRFIDGNGGDGDSIAAVAAGQFLGEMGGITEGTPIAAGYNFLSFLNLHYSYCSVTKKLNGSASAWAQRWRWRM